MVGSKQSFIQCAPLLALGGFDFFAVEDDIVPHPCVVKRTDANASPNKRFVRRGHDRVIEIVKKHVDLAILDRSNDFDTVPGVVLPGRSPGRSGGDLRAWGIIHDKDLIGVIICLLAEVDVVEIGRILVAEEEAQTPMPVLLRGRFHLGREREVAYVDILEQGNTKWAPVRRLVLAFSGGQLQHVSSSRTGHLPGIRIRRLPALRATLEILLQNEIGRGEQGSCREQKAHTEPTTDSVRYHRTVVFATGRPGNLIHPGSEFLNSLYSFCISCFPVYRFPDSFPMMRDSTTHSLDSVRSIHLPPSQYPRIVVVGGGFAGINFIKAMKDTPYQIVLLDQNNFHQFQPLLYQVATCGLEPDAIIFPLRKLFEGYDQVCFRMTKVREVDLPAKEVVTGVGRIRYDKLVLATGSVSNFFGNEQIEELGIGMKNIRESLNIRSLVLENLEMAAMTADPAEREAFTNFVVVGGGPAGVETVGALAEFKRYILNKDYPDIDADVMKVFLVQSGDRLLKGMSRDASDSAARDLRKLGVELVFNNRVKSYDGNVVTTDTGMVIPARALVWTAGVQGALPSGVSENAVAAGNRAKVDCFNQIIGLEDVYAIGDLACMESEEHPWGHPMVAPAAIQQGAHLAGNLRHELEGRPLLPFRYFDKGSLATIGKRRAVADVGAHHLHGFLAWLIWCFVHILYLIGFRNKFLVFTNWMMSYLTYEKGNRFIVRRFRKV